MIFSLLGPIDMMAHNDVVCLKLDRLEYANFYLLFKTDKNKKHRYFILFIYF